MHILLMKDFLEIDPYNIKSLKQFHGIMTKYVVEESGDFRCGEEGVFNGGQCISWLLRHSLFRS